MNAEYYRCVGLFTCLVFVVLGALGIFSGDVVVAYGAAAIVIWSVNRK